MQRSNTTHMEFSDANRDLRRRLCPKPLCSLTEIARYVSNPGALKAWLLLRPIMLPNAPLVVALHGCTQNAEAYAEGSGWSQLAERQGFAALYTHRCFRIWITAYLIDS